MMEKQQPVVDVKEPTSSFTEGSKASPEAVPTDDTDGESVSDQHGDGDGDGDGDETGTRSQDDEQQDPDHT